MGWRWWRTQKTISKFLESFEITNIKEHFVVSQEIEKWLIDEKIGLTPTKFSMELKRYCTLKKYNIVESKDKKIAGRTKKTWLGIKKIQDEVEDDDDEPKSSLDIII